MSLATDPGNRHRRVAAARADFLENGRPGAAGISDLVAASWERSKSAGVDAERASADYSGTVDTASRLVRCARPVIDQLGSDISDMALSIALTDNKARLIERVDISSGLGRLLDRVSFAPGYAYQEDTIGTNGVGTVIESGQAVSVVGPEHYSEYLQQFACTAAPVVDPITGKVEGILDVSTVAKSWSPIMHTLVKSAAKDIANNLLLDRSQAQQVLFNTYLKADARCSKHAVFGYARSVVMANAAAQTLFSQDEQTAIRDHATFLMQRRDRASDTVTLSSGREVRMHGTRIVSAGVTAGIVVIAEPVAPQSLSDDLPNDRGFDDEVLPDVSVTNARTTSIVTDLRRGRRTPIVGGISPAWARACRHLRAAMRAGDPTLVFGETGSGRFTLAVELFHADHPRARSVSIDATQLESGVDIDAPALIDQPNAATLIIIRDIDQLGPDGVANLGRVLDAAEMSSTPVSVVATVGSPDEMHASEVLCCFRASVAVPPLRHRTEDLEHIVGRIVADVAPHRHVRLAPAALRMIAAYSWPRNVTQLREALGHALKARPVGEIQVDDLPRYCQTTANHHRLSPIEIAERDTLIAALQANDGNRVAAAAHVGISRSSLYRKIKSYGITV